MRIGTSTFTTNLLTELNKLTAQQVRLSEQLSTLSKINKADDNPLAFGEITQVQSRARGMESYRSNLDRAEMISDLNKNSLGLLQASVKEAVKAATLLNTTLTDKDAMKRNVNFLDTLIEQAIFAANTKNGEDSLFAGSHFNVDAFNISKNTNGNATFAVGIIRQDVGGKEPKLVTGNYYRIENATGVDFRLAGAEKNDAGTVFQYNGTAIDWIPGSGSALTAVSANINEAGKKKLIEGRAYEIVKLGKNSELRNSGATVNKVGAQFIYNGKLPTTWDGAELAALVTDYERPISEKEYTPYEFYRITSGSETAFDENAVVPVISDVFQYNGTPVTDTTASAVKLVSIVEEGNKKDLVIGQLYQIVDSDGTFAGGGAPVSAQTGDIFQYDGTSITSWGAGKLIPVNANNDVFYHAGDTGPLVEGEFYRIRGSGDNFADLSTPPNDGTIGRVFQYNGNAVNFGAGQLSPLDADIDPSNLSGSDIGEAFIVVGGNATLTGGGAGLTAKAGTRFIYDGTAFQPEDFGGATLTRLSDDVNVKSLKQENLYKIAKAGNAGNELPNLTKGDSLVAGKTYRIEKLSTDTNFTGVFKESAPYSVGSVVTATGTQPAVWGTAELKSMVVQTADSFTGTALQVGRTYQIATTTAARTETYKLGDSNALIVGETYTITNNGSKADFSAVATADTIDGTQYPNTGKIFKAENVTSSSVVNFDRAVLVEVDSNGKALTGAPITEFLDPSSGLPNLQNGSYYQVVDNGSPMDMTLSGAVSNNTGTTFTYNGTQPTWAYGTLSYDIPASDFTSVGAASNAVGTNFTATSDWPEWGSGATLRTFRGEFAEEADLTDIGASLNDVGTIFNYNGVVPTDSPVIDAGSVLFGYKREVLAAEYAGSSTNAEGFYIAENLKMSPYADAEDNLRFADAINSMVSLREAFKLASEANVNDAASRFASQERLSESGRLIDIASKDIEISVGNVEMNAMLFKLASDKDDRIYKNIGDIVDKRKGVDQAQMMTQLNEAYSAYQMALQTGSQIGRSNLFDYL